LAALRRIAELHSAARGSVAVAATSQRPADYKSAVQQIANLRYAE